MGIIAGAGIAGVGTYLLHKTVAHAFVRGKAQKTAYMAWLAVIQPGLLLVPLFLFALWKPDQLFYVGAGAAAWYTGYLVYAAVRQKRYRGHAERGTHE